MQLDHILLSRHNGMWVGEQIKADCPRCTGHSPQTLSYNPSMRAFICFRCNWKGHAKKLAEALGCKAGSLDLSLEPTAVVKKPPPIPRELPSGSIPLRSAGGLGRAPLAWLAKGGISAEDAERYQLHFIVSGILAFRVIFPVIEEGRVVYWTARSYIGGEPRYRNPRRGETLLARNDCVFGLDQVPDRARELLVFEGARNAMVAGQGSTAILGKNWSPAQVRKLVGKHARRYVIALDRDAMGTDGLSVGGDIQELRRSSGLMLASEIAALLGNGQVLDVVPWPCNPKKDAADMGRTATREYIEEHKLRWSMATEAYLRMSAVTLHKQERPKGLRHAAPIDP